MKNRKIVLNQDSKPEVLPCPEDLLYRKLEQLNGKVYYAVDYRIPVLEKSSRRFLYKLHLFSILGPGKNSRQGYTREYSVFEYRWIAMWNSGVSSQGFPIVEEAMEYALKKGWKVAQIDNAVNDQIIYCVEHAVKGE